MLNEYELGLKLAGTPELDINLLKKYCKLEGYKESDK